MLEKRFLHRILCCCLVLSLSLATVHAAQVPESPEIMPCYLYTSDVSCSLSRDDESISAEVTGQPGVATKCRIWLQLQRKSGSAWSNVDSWSETENGDYLFISEDVTLDEDASYRAKASITVWSGTKSETINIYSSVV